MLLFLLLSLFLCVLPDSFQFLRHHAGALGNIVAQMHFPAQRFEPFGQLPDLRPMCVGLFGTVPDCLCAQCILQYPALADNSRIFTSCSFLYKQAARRYQLMLCEQPYFL